MDHQHTTQTPRRRKADYLALDDSLPDLANVRRPTILGVSGFSSTTLDRLIKSGKFPPGRLVSARIRVWTAGEIRRWLAAQGGD